jgi:teichuronic acid biosynthesis glycosyltransferase TuaC
MRVLFVTNDFPSLLDSVGGIFIAKQAIALRDLGHDVSVLRIIPYAPPLGRWYRYHALGSSYEYEGLRVNVGRTVILPRLCNFERLRAQTGTLLRRAIAQFTPDVVHAHYIQYPGSIAVGRGVPAVITSHGIDAYDWPWQRDGLRRDAARTIAQADAVVAVSGAIANWLRRLHDRTIDVIFNGADARFFGTIDRARARKELRIPAERPVLAYAGYLVPAKGVFDMAAALARLPEKPLLLVAGEGPSSQELVTALREANVEARYYGNVPQATVASIFAAADVITLPSHNEGLPVTVCEAMLTGRPVVATTVGGIPEIVTHGSTGYLCEAHDVERLAELYRTAFENKEQATAIGAAAQRFARDRLTWDANARSYSRLYRRVVEECAA